MPVLQPRGGGASASPSPAGAVAVGGGVGCQAATGAPPSHPDSPPPPPPPPPPTAAPGPRHGRRRPVRPPGRPGRGGPRAPPRPRRPLRPLPPRHRSPRSAPPPPLPPGLPQAWPLPPTGVLCTLCHASPGIATACQLSRGGPGLCLGQRQRQLCRCQAECVGVDVRAPGAGAQVPRRGAWLPGPRPSPSSPSRTPCSGSGWRRSSACTTRRASRPWRPGVGRWVGLGKGWPPHRSGSASRGHADRHHPNGSAQVLKALADFKGKAESEEALAPVEAMMSEAFKEVDKAVVKGVVKKNTANRRKSRLSVAKKKLLISSGLYMPAPAI